MRNDRALQAVEIGPAVQRLAVSLIIREKRRNCQLKIRWPAARGGGETASKAPGRLPAPSKQPFRFSGAKPESRIFKCPVAFLYWINTVYPGIIAQLADPGPRAADRQTLSAGRRRP